MRSRQRRIRRKEAGMVELVDSVDLGSTAKSVQVRVLLPAPSPFAVIDTMAAKGDSYFNVYFLITPCFPNFLPIFLPLIGI